MRSASSARYKNNIADLEINTENIYKLRPVSYNSNGEKGRFFGLVAEEVALVIPEMVEWAREKDVVKGSTSDVLIPDAVKYPALSILLLKEVQKHQQMLLEKDKEVTNLKTMIEELSKSNAALNDRLEKLEKK
jgi:hypothetical protein